MKSSRRETPLDRRLRELREQAAALERDIRLLDKSARTGGVVDADARVRAATAAARRAELSRLNPNYAASVGSGTTTSVSVTNQGAPPDEGEEAAVNLFSVGEQARGDGPAPAPFAASTQSDSATDAPRYRRVAAPPREQKLANYLASGSFGGKVPLSHERQVQRFRAILALMAVATFAYIIYRAIFR